MTRGGLGGPSTHQGPDRPGDGRPSVMDRVLARANRAPQERTAPRTAPPPPTRARYMDPRQAERNIERILGGQVIKRTNLDGKEVFKA